MVVKKQESTDRKKLHLKEKSKTDNAIHLALF